MTCRAPRCRRCGSRAAGRPGRTTDRSRRTACAVVHPDLGLAGQDGQHFLDRRAGGGRAGAGRAPLLEDAELGGAGQGRDAIRVRTPARHSSAAVAVIDDPACAVSRSSGPLEAAKLGGHVVRMNHEPPSSTCVPMAASCCRRGRRPVVPLSTKLLLGAIAGRGASRVDRGGGAGDLGRVAGAAGRDHRRVRRPGRRSVAPLAVIPRRSRWPRPGFRPRLR